jgi:hypothetical protein
VSVHSTLEVLDPGENEVEIVAENGSKRTEYSRVVTRKLTAEEIAAKEAAEEEAARRASKYATIGETVRVGDVEWTVTNARYTETLTAEFASPKSGNFVVVDFNFTNLGDEAVTLSTISLPLVDSQGREYEADTDSFMYVPLQKDIFLEQVNPGVTKQGQVIYSVAPDASGFTLQAGDLAFFSGETARIKLGF